MVHLTNFFLSDCFFKKHYPYFCFKHPCTLIFKHISNNSLDCLSRGGIGSGDRQIFKAWVDVAKVLLGKSLFLLQSLRPTLAGYKTPHFSSALPTLDIVFLFHFCQSDRQNVSYSDLHNLNSEAELLCVFIVCIAVYTYIWCIEYIIYTYIDI